MAWLTALEPVMALMALNYGAGHRLPARLLPRAGLLAVAVLALKGDLLRQACMTSLVASAAGLAAPWRYGLLCQADVWLANGALALCVAWLGPRRAPPNEPNLEHR